MRAAGIAIRGDVRLKLRGINYNEEIPFEHAPPPGLYDVSGEPNPTPKPFKTMRVDEMEGQRRTDKENEARKEDAARQKRRKEADLPSAILQMNRYEPLFAEICNDFSWT